MIIIKQPESLFSLTRGTLLLRIPATPRAVSLCQTVVLRLYVFLKIQFFTFHECIPDIINVNSIVVIVPKHLKA